MSTEVLTNAQIYTAGVDLTGQSNSIGLDLKADELDATTFGSGGWRERKGGLKTANLKQSGFVDFPNPDLEAFTELALGGTPVTVANSPTGVAYVFRALRGSYSLLGAIGALAPMVGELAGDAGSGVGRGRILYSDATVTGDDTGSGFQLGAVSAGKSLVIAVHVFSGSTTATITVESDSSNAFSSPTTQATAVVTGSGDSQFIKVDGAITDTWYRVTTSSVTGSFSIAVAAGVTG